MNMYNKLQSRKHRVLARITVALLSLWLSLLIGYNISLHDELSQIVNTCLWIASNLVIGYILFALIVFVIGYYILFDPKATTAGKFVFRFMVALLGAMGLIFIGVFVNPAPGREWFQYAGDIYWWRPIIRFLIYVYVAYSITSLAVLLVIRKYFPSKVKTALDREIVKTRDDTKKNK